MEKKKVILENDREYAQIILTHGEESKTKLEQRARPFDFPSILYVFADGRRSVVKVLVYSVA